MEASNNNNFTIIVCIKITFKIHRCCVKDGNVNKQSRCNLLTIILTHNHLFTPRSHLICKFDDDHGHYTEDNVCSRNSSLKYNQEQNSSLSSLWNPRDFLAETQSFQRDRTHTTDTGNLSHSTHVGHTRENAARSKVTNSISHPLEPLESVLRALKHQPACLCCGRTHGKMKTHSLSDSLQSQLRVRLQRNWGRRQDHSPYRRGSTE